MEQRAVLRCSCLSRPLAGSRYAKCRLSTAPRPLKAQASSQGHPSSQTSTASSASSSNAQGQQTAPTSTSTLRQPEPQRLRAVEVPYHEVDASSYDLDLMHYKIPMLKFLNPPVVIGAGCAFIVAANLMQGGPSMEITVEAAVPVLLWWFILLHVLPSAFKEFAVSYMETHEFVGDDQQQQQQQQQQGVMHELHEKE